VDELRIEVERLKGALSNAVHSLDDFKARAFRLERERDIAEAEAVRLRRDWSEQVALLDQRDGPPVYSTVLARAEQAEAKLARVTRRCNFWTQRCEPDIPPGKYDRRHHRCACEVAADILDIMRDDSPQTREDRALQARLAAAKKKP
jgi:hypothetical protein